MPHRFIPFVTGQFYHIYNRGSEKRIIFQSKRDYQRFLKTLEYYQLEGPKPKFSHFPNLVVQELDSSKKMVEIVAYCLMPNHFHLLVKQLRDNGITEFVSKFLNSYTRYFNTKHDRVGPLFQGMVKAVLIETDDQLVHISRYIHLNPLTSFLVKDLAHYKWSSYQDYLDNHSSFCSTDEILGHFKNPQDYQQFILDQVSYAQEIEFIKHQIIDEV
ncbi:MAG: transposase [bacterium]|nr:transposase [bacterium]